MYSLRAKASINEAISEEVLCPSTLIEKKKQISQWPGPPSPSRGPIATDPHTGADGSAPATPHGSPQPLQPLTRTPLQPAAAAAPHRSPSPLVHLPAASRMARFADGTTGVGVWAQRRLERGWRSVQLHGR